jgi:TPR repeat protein
VGLLPTRTAARAGNNLAYKDLANIYFSGLESNAIVDPARSVRPDLSQAKKMFLACTRDDVVGRACKIGVGHILLAQDDADANAAVAVFEEAHAWETLWGLYYFGVGVRLDRVRAEAYLQRIKKETVDGTPPSGFDSCAADIRDSADALTREDPKALVEIALKFAAWSGRAECLAGGPMHHLALLERAVKAGSATATKLLGDDYYFGRLTGKDPVLAFYYYSVLNRIGDVKERYEANDRLDTLERTLSPTDLSEARTMFRKWGKQSG